MAARIGGHFFTFLFYSISLLYLAFTSISQFFLCPSIYSLLSNSFLYTLFLKEINSRMQLHAWRTDALVVCLLACSSVCLPSHSHACRLVFCRNASPMFVFVFVLSPPIILSLQMRFTSMCPCIALVSCVHVFSPNSYCLSVCLSACLPASRRHSGYSQSRAVET